MGLQNYYLQHWPSHLCNGLDRVTTVWDCSLHASLMQSHQRLLDAVVEDVDDVHDGSALDDDGG